MIWAIGVVGFIAFCCFVAALDGEECPRMILGYNCHGKTCDHSPDELAGAKDLLRHR
jgi:hypothetical protein